jgi:hypothetical protein
LINSHFWYLMTVEVDRWDLLLKILSTTGCGV